MDFGFSNLSFIFSISVPKHLQIVIFIQIGSVLTILVRYFEFKYVLILRDIKFVIMARKTIEYDE